MCRSARLYNCVRCHCQAIICSHCDYGNRYCSGHWFAQLVRKSYAKRANAINPTQKNVIYMPCVSDFIASGKKKKCIVIVIFVVVVVVVVVVNCSLGISPSTTPSIFNRSYLFLVTHNSQPMHNLNMHRRPMGTRTCYGRTTQLSWNLNVIWATAQRFICNTLN